MNNLDRPMGLRGVMGMEGTVGIDEGGIGVVTTTKGKDTVRTRVKEGERDMVKDRGMDKEGVMVVKVGITGAKMDKGAGMGVEISTKMGAEVEVGTVDEGGEDIGVDINNTVNSSSSNNNTNDKIRNDPPEGQAIPM